MTHLPSMFCLLNTFTLNLVNKPVWSSWEGGIITIIPGRLEHHQKYVLDVRLWPNPLSPRPEGFPRIQASVTGFTCDTVEKVTPIN